MPELVAETQDKKEVEQRQMGSMSLLQHLEELRKRVIYCVAAVAICFGAGWYKADYIYGKMMVPIMAALKKYNWDTQLTYLNPTDPFNNYMKIGLIAGIFIASRVLLSQVWMLISPGLYRNDKRFVLPFLFLTCGL